MTTQNQLVAAPHADADERVANDVDVPLSHGMQRQGDVLVIPLPHQQPSFAQPSADTTSIPGDGVSIVRAEATENTHLLLGDGTWSPSTNPPDVGVLHVTTAAYLIHQEHTALGIGQGSYLLRRQREHTQTGFRILSD